VLKINTNLKVKQMKTKRAKVIMLPTKDISQITLNTYINETHNCSNLQFNFKPKFSNEDAKSMGFEYQHLYITTNDEIKEGDEMIKGAWYINTFRGFGEPFMNDNLCNNGYLRQIIATTDKSLVTHSYYPQFTNDKSKIDYYLPQPSQAFIEKYCKLGGIDEVLVEYVDWCDYDDDDPTGLDRPDLRLKVDSHNTITIHPIKDSWSRKEVIQLIRTFDMFMGKDIPTKDFDNWIKENL